MARILAIDPGSVSGAWALLIDTETTPGTTPDQTDQRVIVRTDDLPVIAKQVDAHQFARLVLDLAPSIAVIEQVGVLPKQGIASGFRFGVSVGLVRGVLAALQVPLYAVAPGTWKRHFKLAADKEQARAMAQRIYPQVANIHLKKHHGRAEAILLATYWRALNPDNKIQPYPQHNA